MFRCNHHHQGEHYSILLKLQLLKQSTNHIDVFLIILTNVTLARSNNVLLIMVITPKHVGDVLMPILM
jgi:hypothetical protein